MDIEKLVEGLRAGSLTRREFKQVLAGLGVGAVTVPMTWRPAHAEGEVMYFGWAGYETPEFHPSYKEKYGGPPEATFWADGDEAFQKLRQGFAPDVMHPCTESLVKWREAGFLSELDPQRLEWLPDIFGSLTDIQGSLHDGKRYFMPMDWGNSTVIYRTDLVASEHAGENLSWAILFDDWYKGRISTYDTIDNVKIAGLLMGFDNIFSLTEEQLAQTRPLLERQRDNSRFYWGDNSEIEQALASGELVAAYGWNDSYVRLREQGVPIALGIPKEGIFTWCCGLTIHPGTRNLEASYDLINAMTSPQAGAYEIEYWGFGHANKQAFDLVSGEVLDDLGLSTPEAMLNNGIYFEAVGPEFEENYVRLFDEVKSGF